MLRKEKAITQQLLTPTQEGELIEYIEGLTKRYLLLTRLIIKNSTSKIARKELLNS